VAEHDVAVRVRQVLVELYAGPSLAQHGGERRLTYFERLAPQFAAVELDHFGSLSLVVRVEPPIAGSVRGGCAWQRSYLQATQSSEVSYLYFERVAAAAPATALARSSYPFGACGTELNRCRALATKIANELRNKRPEHFVDKLSLADVHASLERAADVLSTVKGSQARGRREKATTG
jgi:hypothetical protein